MRRVDYKWTMLGQLTLAYFLAQGVRQVYSSSLPEIKSAFAASGLSDADLGLVGSAFALVYGLAMPLSGLAADFFRRKAIVVAGVLLFSLGIFAVGFAQNLWMLVAAFGVANALGQALFAPATTSLIGQHHVETRGTAFSVYQAGVYAGTVVCGTVAGLFAGAGGDVWRWGFWTFGAAGVVWALVLAGRLEDTPPVMSEGAERPSVAVALSAVVKCPTALLLMLALGFYFYALFGVKTWLPAYLRTAYPGVSAESAAFHGVIWFYLGSFAGVFAGGRLSDRFRARRRAVRLETNLLGLLGAAPFLLAIAFAPNYPLCAAASGLFGLACGFYDSNLYATLMDVVDARYRAAAVGVFGCGGCVLGSLGPLAIGWMGEHLTRTAGFVSMAGAAAAGAALLFAARLFTFERDVR